MKVMCLNCELEFNLESDITAICFLFLSSALFLLCFSFLFTWAKAFESVAFVPVCETSVNRQRSSRLS